MRRVRLKADGRLVEILPDGREQDLSAVMSSLPAVASPSLSPEVPAVVGHGVRRPESDAAYAKSVRAMTGLTQTVFAARIGVPLETVRNWEQGKRAPRGPARALLKLLEHAPDVAFSVLGNRRSAS